VKLYVLNGGRLWTERGFLSHFGTLDDTGKEYAPGSYEVRCSSYFIDHPQAKIVFDLGYKIEDFEQFAGFPHRRSPEGVHFAQGPDENPIAQLAKAGVEWKTSITSSFLISCPSTRGGCPSSRGTRRRS